MKSIGSVIIANAIVWAAVLIACSLELRGTDAYQQIQFILAGGSMASLFVVGVGTLKVVKMIKSQQAK